MKTTKSIAARRSTKSTATKSKSKAVKVRRVKGARFVPQSKLFDEETGAPPTPEAERIDAEAVAMFPPLKYVIVREDGTKHTGEMMDPRAEIYRLRAPRGHKVFDGNESPSAVVLIERPDDFNPTDPTTIPPFMFQRYVQPTVQLAHEFAQAFNEAELKPESEGGNKRIWAVAVDRLPTESPADEPAAAAANAGGAA